MRDNFIYSVRLDYFLHIYTHYAFYMFTLKLYCTRHEMNLIQLIYTHDLHTQDNISFWYKEYNYKNVTN